jgi:hypothetical protein
LVVASLVSITLVIQDSIAAMVESLIPYQEVSNFLM